MEVTEEGLRAKRVAFQMRNNLLWRKVISICLVFYLASVAALVGVAPDPDTWLKTTVSMVCFVVAAMTVTYSSRRFRLPLEQWSYLMSGGIGVFMVLAFEFTTPDVEFHFRLSIGLLLASGLLGSFAAHQVDRWVTDVILGRSHG